MGGVKRMVLVYRGSEKTSMFPLLVGGRNWEGGGGGGRATGNVVE